MPETLNFNGLDVLEPQIHQFPFGEFCIFTVKANDKDGPNEDSAAIVSLNKQSGIIVLADGVGGHAVGDKASKTAIHVISKAVAKADNTISDLSTIIIPGIDKANEKVMALYANAATTLVIAEISGDTLRTYHAGDSIALVTGQRGKLKFQTIAHSPTGYALESGLLDQQEAMQADDRHIVSNILGDAEMRIELGPRLKLGQRDTVLLASDGLSDNMLIDDIVEIIRKGPLLDAAKYLMRSCMDRMQQPDGKDDDLTVVLFRRK
jgi:serine/threonine protein phosphatase PrpC